MDKKKTKIVKKGKQLSEEFKTFALSGATIGAAVGIMMGAALNSVISSLVIGFFNAFKSLFKSSYSFIILPSFSLRIF